MLHGIFEFLIIKQFCKATFSYLIIQVIFDFVNYIYRLFNYFYIELGFLI